MENMPCGARKHHRLLYWGFGKKKQKQKNLRTTGFKEFYIQRQAEK